MTNGNNKDIFTDSPAKKWYTVPRLLEYGHVADLTQGSLTVGNDSGAGKKNHGGLLPGNNPTAPKKKRG
jgi:hypothetical protein